MERKAYLVGFLDRDTGEYAGCEIFSEENPTCSLKFFPFTIIRRGGETFDDAVQNLEKVLDLPEYSFLKMKLNKRPHP